MSNPSNYSKLIILVIVLSASIVLNHSISKEDSSVSRKSLSQFPTTLGDWVAVSDHKIDDESMRILQVDDYIIRDYRNSNGETISLYIGYFKAQREGKGIHSPRQCLPGAGWVPVNAAVYQMQVPGHNPALVQVNKFIMGKGLDRELYLFWYHGRGRIYASEYWNKIYLIWDGLTKKRTDGALIRINFPITGDTESVLKKQSEFVQGFFQTLKEYIPD